MFRMSRAAAGPPGNAGAPARNLPVPPARNLPVPPARNLPVPRPD